MGDFSTDITCSDVPKFAAQDIPVTDQTSLRPCAACQSSHTVRLYSEGAGSIIGYYRDEEYLCLDCGRYTQYSLDYDS